MTFRRFLGPGLSVIKNALSAVIKITNALTHDAHVVQGNRHLFHGDEYNDAVLNCSALRKYQIPCQAVRLVVHIALIIMAGLRRCLIEGKQIT